MVGGAGAETLAKLLQELALLLKPDAGLDRGAIDAPQATDIAARIFKAASRKTKRQLVELLDRGLAEEIARP
jgi:hypothetical protein